MKKLWYYLYGDSMQRYFILDNQIQENQIILTDSDFHHIKNVMRFGVGDLVMVITKDKTAYKASIQSFTKKEVVLSIVEKQTLNDNILNISLAQALIKKDAFELVLQKTTELGVKEIFPFSSKRSIIKIDDFAKKKIRYETIVKEASEQSERSAMPLIHDLSTLDTLPYERFDQVYIAYAREDDVTLKQIVTNYHTNESILILIGPEGGFSESEIAKLKEKGTILSLGETILRSETAAIHAISVFRYLGSK